MPSVATSRPSTLPETTTDAAVTDPLKLAVVPNRAPVIVSPLLETDSTLGESRRSSSAAAVTLKAKWVPVLWLIAEVPS